MKYLWHDGAWWPAVRTPRPPVAPAIIRDGMDALVHPATGETFDSKSAFRAATRDAGCVELGNDVTAALPAYQRTPGLRDDIHAALKMLNEGYRPEPGEALDGETRIYGAP